MRKILLAAALGLSCLFARGETISLGAAGCDALKQCGPVPNDTGIGVDIDGLPNSSFFLILLTEPGPDGQPVTTSYASTVPSGDRFDNVLLTSLTGLTIVATGAYDAQQTCVRVRLKRVCSIHWTFLGGTILR